MSAADFARVSFKEVLVLTQVLSRKTLYDVGIIKQDYSRFAPHFQEILRFADTIGLLKINGQVLIPSSRYAQIIKSTEEEHQREDRLRKLIISLMILRETEYSPIIRRFLSFCAPEHGYEMELSLSERLKFSGLRNFLMELEFLSAIPGTEKYSVSAEYVAAYFEASGKVSIPRGKFEDILRAKAEIGLKGELEILNYEKGRLASWPDLVSQIEHVADSDVCAGYDIKSFSVDPARGHAIPRYVEVKMVSALDYKFYWTKNEINQARIYNDQYFLYLLPFAQGKSVALDALMIIQNPVDGVINAPQRWLREEEVASFSLNSGDDAGYLPTIH